MKPTRAKEVLYDSETVLRLVERELQELRNDMTTPPASHKGSAPAAKAKGESSDAQRAARTSNAEAAADAQRASTPTKRRRS